MTKDRNLDLLTSSYDYDLPSDLVAHRPLAQRDGSRLMVLEGEKEISHRVFSDLPAYLNPGDCLVLNDSRVMPARLMGRKAGTGGSVECLLLGPAGGGLWRVLVKPGRHARPGQRILFADGRLEAQVEGVEAEGTRLLAFDHQGDFMALIDEIGEVPLPPYIHEKLDDPDRYQTVYAEEKGSAAAPTAGLHFTRDLLDQIRERGVHLAPLTLHVGLGTFRPVKEKLITGHVMHREYFSLPQNSVETILKARAGGGRIIAVGTTSCRVLESVAHRHGRLEGVDPGPSSLLWPARGETDLFIYPGFEFKVVDGLLTNFHLPESTLLMLVSALMGRERIMEAYREAVKEAYRFFSFGDAMLLMPDQ